MIRQCSQNHLIKLSILVTAVSVAFTKASRDFEYKNDATDAV